MKNILLLAWCLMLLMRVKCNFTFTGPPQGPPVITGYIPGQKPHNGDILVCNVTGGYPHVDRVSFECHTSTLRLTDQDDSVHSWSVSSSVTLVSSPAIVGNMTCVCSAHWARNPSMYLLNASIVFPLPLEEPTTQRSPTIQTSYQTFPVTSTATPAVPTDITPRMTSQVTTSDIISNITVVATSSESHRSDSTPQDQRYESPKPGKDQEINRYTNLQGTSDNRQPSVHYANTEFSPDLSQEEYFCEPPSGPPVITGYSPGQQPENGDILVCTVTGGSPLVDMVLFNCHTPHLLDQNDIRNQTSVSSSLTLNSSQATVDSLVCVCTALWAPDPQQYQLAASIVYPVPRHLACFRRDYDVTKVPETITETSSAFTDSANDGPSTGQEGNTAENGQHQTNYSGQERHKNDTHLDTSVYENCAQPELGAHAYMNCPSQSARTVPDITITYYEGDYASVDVATGDDGTEYAKPYLYASVSKAPGEKQTSSNMSAQENKHTPTRKTITGPLGDVYAVPSK
ncbi:hypothetical protein BaRGS_00011337 [Batillaria attramentaria]|uniref:Uncharacterized protein n=1 Tax=Batillaria attramentaria TaxID=370345 RepID=A0ABD0LDI5_9CAEN